MDTYYSNISRYRDNVWKIKQFLFGGIAHVYHRVSLGMSFIVEWLFCVISNVGEVRIQ